VTDPSFLDALAGRQPTPAGGSAAAFAGAMGAALVAKTCRVSGGAPQLDAILARVEGLRGELTALVEEDAAAFRAVLAEGSAASMRAATLAPLSIAERAAQVRVLGAEAKRLAKRHLASDCQAGIILAVAATSMAAATVNANLSQIEDAAFCAEVSARLDAALSG